jgi:hypothetical protein
MLKVNTDPNCPGADIRKGDSLHTWDTVHQDRGKHSMASIPKDRWNEIFGDIPAPRRQPRDNVGKGLA